MGSSRDSGDNDPLSVSRAQGVASVDSLKLDGVESVESDSKVDAIDEDAKSPEVERIAKELTSNTLDPVQAQFQLVEECVSAQLGSDADPKLVDEVRRQVMEILDIDPTIARLLDPRR